jgi:hypothetical protein
MDIIESFRERGLDALADLIEAYPTKPKEEWSELQKAMVLAKEKAASRLIGHNALNASVGGLNLLMPVVIYP